MTNSEIGPRSLKKLVWIQIFLVFGASLAIVVIGSQVPDMIREKQRIEMELKQKQEELDSLKKKLEDTHNAVDDVARGKDAFFASPPNYGKAIEHYSAAEQLDPDNPNIRRYKAYALFKNREFDASITAYQGEAQLRKEAARPFIHIDLARVYCAKHDFVLAESQLSAAEKAGVDLKAISNPNHPRGDGEFARLCSKILAKGR